MRRSSVWIGSRLGSSLPPCAGPVRFHLAHLEFEGTAQDRESSFRLYGESIAGLGDLVADFPDRPFYRYDLARALKCRGIAHRHVGGAEAMPLAEQDLEDSLLVYRALAARFPRRPGLEESLADHLLEFASSLDWSRAGTTKRGTGSRRPFARSRPWQRASRNHRYPPDSGTALQTIGLLDYFAGRFEAAEESSRKALKVREQVARAEPGNRDYRHEELTSRIELANLLDAKRRPEESQSMLKAGVAKAESFAADYPDYSVALATVMDFRLRMALASVDSAKTEEDRTRTGAALRRVAKDLEAAVRSHPEDKAFRVWLGSLYSSCPVESLRNHGRAISILVRSQARMMVPPTHSARRSAAPVGSVRPSPWPSRSRRGSQTRTGPVASPTSWPGPMCGLGDHDEAARWFREAEQAQAGQPGSIAIVSSGKRLRRR